MVRKEDTYWETEFIDAFERIYNKLDYNSDLLYFPVFQADFIPKDCKFNPIDYMKNENTDLITQFQLPESNYSRQLPKITDLSKCTIALKNLQNFDRYVVGEIFNYCNKQYRDDEYLNSLSQIRYHLSNGDVASAKGDINIIFDGNKTPAYMPMPKELYDLKEITKEECYPGNYYLAKLSRKFIRESGIKSLIKQGAIGINEIPVLLLLHDNTINQALVMYTDHEFGKVYTFWTAIDTLMFLENQIKIPASSFRLSELLKEYKYLEKRLRILYSKNVFANIMYCLASKKKIHNFGELLNGIALSNWQVYKLNPVSGVFHTFKNYISLKTRENDINTLGKSN